MYTGKPTKNVITKEMIENELLEKSKKSLVRSIVFIFAWTLAVAAIFFAFYHLALKNSELGWLPYAIYFFSLSVFLVPLLLGGLSLNIAVTDMRDIRGGKLAVITDTVYSKEEKPSGYRGRDSTHLVRVVNLSSLGVEIELGSTQYDLTADGDVFYVAYFTGRKIKIPQVCYPAKMYEYKE